MRGAQNDGTCYFVDQIITGEKVKLTDTFTDPFIHMMVDTVDVNTYFEDPVLSFEDSLIYGCSLSLNLEELK